MINLAGLEPQYFRAILEGRKRTERRTRKRIDGTLERLRAGEAVVLFEKRSLRALACRVRHVRRVALSGGGYKYCIRLTAPTLIVSAAIPHTQGWRRMATWPAPRQA